MVKFLIASQDCGCHDKSDHGSLSSEIFGLIQRLIDIELGELQLLPSASAAGSEYQPLLKMKG